MKSQPKDTERVEHFVEALDARASMWRCPQRPASASGTAAYDAIEQVLRSRALRRDGRAVAVSASPSSVESMAYRIISAIDDLRAQAEVPRWLFATTVVGALVGAVWLALGQWLLQPGPPCPVHPVVGHVAMGKLAPAGAQIVFHPVVGELPEQAVPRAVVRDDGSFVVSTFRSEDGAPAGEYVVTIQWFRVTKDGLPGPNAMPAKYASPGSSPLRVAVSPGTNELTPLAICR